MSAYLFTSESVSEGHPDKLADQISDAVLDAILAQDKNARVACETMVKTGVAIVAGEITTNAWIDLEELVTPGQMNRRPALTLVRTSPPYSGISARSTEPEKTLPETLSTSPPHLVDKVASDEKGDLAETANGTENSAGNSTGYTPDQWLAVLKAIDCGTLTRFSFSSVGKVLKTECGTSGDSVVIRPLVEAMADGFMKEGIVIPNERFEYNEDGKGNGVSKWQLNPDYQRQPDRWNA